MEYVDHGSIQIEKTLYHWVNEHVLRGLQMEAPTFWTHFEKLITTFTPRNRALLEKRDELQRQISSWHEKNDWRAQKEEYRQFLKDIGYLEEPKSAEPVDPKNVDDEIAKQAGSQLVVPLDNARYALNAANARWGSLYDALYGSDIIPEEPGYEQGDSYNPKRGGKVIEFGKKFLDQIAPLQKGSHADAVHYEVQSGTLIVTLANEEKTTLQRDEQFVGYLGQDSLTSVLLEHHQLHVEVQIDPSHSVGKTDQAHVKDIVIEAALSTLMDCEDSVTAVDAEDKLHIYQNWLGLMRGDLTSTFKRGDRTVTRRLQDDKVFLDRHGNEMTLPGRSLMFIRNVGHFMQNNAILLEDGEEVYEGILDGVMTSLIAKYNIEGQTSHRNSRKGSIYIVKPKMHGSEEVAFANDLFNAIEDLLGLERYTIKMGLMDEERRTSINLQNCIREIRHRVVFINTGFLDRTGDEIHTSMEAGPMVRKNDMKSTAWLKAYEQSNVATGLRNGLKGKAQIGKGMWAMPNEMQAMLEQKIAHPQSGATTAWVPSPTAATIHALHYHEVNVEEVQRTIDTERDYVDDMLTIPLAEEANWTEEEIVEELENNAQSILGYVVRWIDQGVGCSTVPDINDVGLMEDRATLRISSQHIANWLAHRICTEEQVREVLERMAQKVDEQNLHDPLYRPMAPNYDDSVAFLAAQDLIFKGKEQPNGYTEAILKKYRLEAKKRAMSTHAS
ncbi:malate synthase G [Savagea faecisuis]|uniref:Malate synthase G n=1 Tax=Savagea faecisuis TaxID=1274803 RepID=A0ABW3GV88_9BACL